jgi:Cu2+-exporting ATPase
VGGSLNTESPLEINVESVGQDTIVSHMLRLMERAQTERPRVALLANKIASKFVLVILTIAALTGLYWYWQGNESWLEIIISLLVVTCPCALSLATPAAMTAATGALASSGLLITRGHALETCSKLTDVVFDKTGTLTDGKLRLHSQRVYGKDNIERCLILAASLEQHSEHLIAQALSAEARAQELSLTQCSFSDVRNHPGGGVTGSLLGERYAIGHYDFIKSTLNARLTDDERVEIVSSGNTLVCLAKEQSIIAVYELADNIRPGAQALIQSLHDQKITTHLFTGDAEQAARRVADALNIKDVKYRMLPSDKLDELQLLQGHDKVVAMVGDGINDSPVLAGAQVSIAMGSAAELTKFNADIVLVANSLRVLDLGLLHAKQTVKIVKQNLAWALIYNTIAIPAAVVGLISPWMAAIGMSVSSLWVVINSTRLRRIAK